MRPHGPHAVHKRLALVAGGLVAALVVVSCSSAPRTPIASVIGPKISVRGQLDGDIPDDVWTAADPKADSVALFAQPGKPLVVDGEPKVLSNPTPEHVPLAFRVLSQRGDWLHVQYPDRPNGTTAWVRRGDVTTRPVAYRIEVHRDAAKVDVYRGTLKLASYPAAMGTASTPTPLGHFYVDVRVLLANQSGPYGAGQISVTGFSDVFQTFGGGRGQIAIHGTNQPSLIGTPVSNGCIRIANEHLLALLDMVPTGTPVDIVA